MKPWCLWRPGLRTAVGKGDCKVTMGMAIHQPTAKAEPDSHSLYQARNNKSQIP